jgi:hypothetical protein
MMTEPNEVECNYECPSCHKPIPAEIWADGQCNHCGRFYTWQDITVICDHESKNQVTIDRAEYERLKALEGKDTNE